MKRTDEFMAKIKKAYKEEDVECIEFALNFACNAHGQQVRASGEPYIIHPIHVAEILVELGMDCPTIIAALLHDIIEDTSVTDAHVKQKFGEEILSLVSAVTKLSRIQFTSKEEEQAENIRKLFIAMAKDMRVLLIKLADRLHNMRTLQFLPPDKQHKIAQETLEIYAPLAGRLGISNIKTELEDLCMKYLHPAEYNYLASIISTKREERMGFVTRICGDIQLQLVDLNIKGDVKGRPKHFYSIFKKMRSQDRTIEQIYDLIAIRVIVESVRDCYTVLGVIHSIWKPIPGRFKDYIAMPKPNMYQSLHTTVVTNFGQTFEIQIRTYDMNRIAEYGIAAHWMYKEGKTADKTTEFDKKLGWIKEVMDVQGDFKDSIEFVDTLKLDVLSNEIFVFTPKGDVVGLLVGANCVDFAYRVHSAVGNRCVGAKVNNKMVPLATTLENGDMVEILTSSQSKGPSRDWLKIVKTPTAKAKIRAFFKKEMQEDNIHLGKVMLERESKSRGYNWSELSHESYIRPILDRSAFSSIEDMYASIGFGSTTTNQILVKAIDLYKKDQAFRRNLEIRAEKEAQPSKKHPTGIIVEGYDDFLIRISKCCSPVPGDDIVGYSSRGRGVCIHRSDCVNTKNFEKERLLKAEWAVGGDNFFIAQLSLQCTDKKGLLSDVTGAISALKLEISSLDARLKEQEDAYINIGVKIKSASELASLISKLSAVSGVRDIKRI